MAHAQYNSTAPAGEAKQLRKKAGAWLKGLRVGQDMTQHALSQKLGLKYYTFISQVEHGATRVPPESYIAWAKALKQDPKEFTKRLLSWYDPHTYHALFGGSKKS